MAANIQIDNFMQDILYTDSDKGEVLVCLREIVLKVAPDAKEEIKYGGLVFVIGKRLFCGIFIRKNHITIEFDRGIEMEDADNYLEGSGIRRHIKLFQQKDIRNKKVEYYIKQSFTL